MTVKELIKELRQYDGDTPVYLCLDWDQTNDQNELIQLGEVNGICSQRIVIDDGLDFHDEEQVLIDAQLTIN